MTMQEYNFTVAIYFTFLNEADVLDIYMDYPIV